MQPYVSVFDLALLATPNMLALVLVAATFLMQFQPLSGWRVLRPGFACWFALFGSMAFSALIAWIWAFAGSSRSDASAQMNIAWWLALTFGLASFLSATQILDIVRARVSWRDDQLAMGNEEPRSLDRVIELRRPLPAY